MSINPQDIVVGTRIRVHNGKATKTNPIGRAPFSVWLTGQMWQAVDCAEGEEFVVTNGPRRGGKPVYRIPEVSCKFVALQRVSGGLVVETYYTSVRFDAEVV